MKQNGPIQIRLLFKNFSFDSKFCNRQNSYGLQKEPKEP